MPTNAENIIANIDFSLRMEDMPLTEEDKKRLRHCINGDLNIDEVLREAIKKHSLIAA